MKKRALSQIILMLDLLIYSFSTFYKLEHYDRIILIFDFDFTVGWATENLVYSGCISGVSRPSVWEMASRYRELVDATSHPWKGGFSAAFKFH